MLRIKVNSSELRAFSVGVFMLSSIHLRQALSFYSTWRRTSNKRRVKTQAFSTIADSTKSTSNSVKDVDGEVKRKKSALYTKTGDKGMSSVRYHSDFLKTQPL